MYPVILALLLAVQQTPPSAENPSSNPVAELPDVRVSGPAPAATNAGGETDAEDRVICRRERVVGSNRPQRICMTRREWTRTSDTTQEQLREVRGGGETLPGNRGGGL